MNLCSIQRPTEAIQQVIERFSQREHLKGIAVYDASGSILAATSGLAPQLQSRPAVAVRAASHGLGYGEFVRIGEMPLHLYALPLRRNGRTAGTLVVLQDAGYIDTQISHTLRDSLLNATLQTLIISLLALVLVRWNFTDPLAQTTKWLRMLRTGQSDIPSGSCARRSF